MPSSRAAASTRTRMRSTTLTSPSFLAHSITLYTDDIRLLSLARAGGISRPSCLPSRETSCRGTIGATRGSCACVVGSTEAASQLGSPDRLRPSDTGELRRRSASLEPHASPARVLSAPPALRGGGAVSRWQPSRRTASASPCGVVRNNAPERRQRAGVRVASQVPTRSAGGRRRRAAFVERGRRSARGATGRGVCAPSLRRDRSARAFDAPCGRVQASTAASKGATAPQPANERSDRPAEPRPSASLRRGPSADRVRTRAVPRRYAAERSVRFRHSCHAGKRRFVHAVPCSTVANAKGSERWGECGCHGRTPPHLRIAAESYLA